ncbi:acyloxyacyl hydrolase [Pelagibacterales bacterium SAG-MED31]|nr:acyloxyacyl hydrolase [Pelagibacterales bacterium SAG-MED31]
MFRLILLSLIILLKSPLIFAQGYDVFGVGIYDVKFDGTSSNYATDIRFERRFDKTLINIGPKEDNFFYLKPFTGIEVTTESAFYFLGGIYLEDNLGKLLIGNENEWNFTPSFGLGYYDDGNGKKLGNKLEFRTTFEISYQLKNENRIGFSLGHISNANIGNKNPGVEIISFTFQKPF